MPNLDRRGFLRSLVGGVAATAAVRTFPFRVYSFPREIVLPGGGYLVPLEVVPILRAEAELLELVRWERSDVLQLFRIPVWNPDDYMLRWSTPIADSRQPIASSMDSKS